MSKPTAYIVCLAWHDGNMSLAQVVAPDIAGAVALVTTAVLRSPTPPTGDLMGATAAVIAPDWMRSALRQIEDEDAGRVLTLVKPEGAA